MINIDYHHSTHSHIYIIVTVNPSNEVLRMSIDDRLTIDAEHINITQGAPATGGSAVTIHV